MDIVFDVNGHVLLMLGVGFLFAAMVIKEYIASQGSDEIDVELNVLCWHGQLSGNMYFFLKIFILL